MLVWKLGVQDPISLHGWQEHVRHNGILREGTYCRLRGLGEGSIKNFTAIKSRGAGDNFALEERGCWCG